MKTNSEYKERYREIEKDIFKEDEYLCQFYVIEENKDLNYLSENDTLNDLYNSYYELNNDNIYNDESLNDWFDYINSTHVLKIDVKTKYPDNLNDISDFNLLIKNIDENFPIYKDFTQYIKNAISLHKKKHSEKSYIDAIDLYKSARSLVEFSHYIPVLHSKPNIKVYLDENTGFFGVIYKRTEKKEGTLNLLIQDDKKVLFSYALKKKGMVKITGVAKFGKYIEDSIEIKKIFKLME